MSPEPFKLVQSLGTCLRARFEAIGTRDGIQLLDWKSATKCEVEETPEGLVFTSIVLTISADVAGNVRRATWALEEAKQTCPIFDSIETPIVVESEINACGRPLMVTEAMEKIAL